MSYEFQIAKRYLTQKRETGFITLIALISIAGLTIGVAALILTLGVLNGFENSIKEKVVEFQADVRLDTFHNQGFSGQEDIEERIRSFTEVESVSPFIEKECMLRFGRQAEGIIVRGVDPDRMASVINTEPLIKTGDFDLSPDEDGNYGIVVGIDLFEQLDLKIGDLIVLSSPPVPGEGMRLLGRPKIRQYELRGVFGTGMSEFDVLFTFISLEEAQSYFNLDGQLTGFDIRLKNLDLAAPFARRLSEDLGYPFYARTWLDLNETLFDWLRVQRLPILIAFGMIILVGGINLISTQILIIHEKRKDIGILKSMGAKSRSIMHIFFQIGLIVGFTSVFYGSILALILGWIQNKYSIISLNKDVYYINTLIIDLEWPSFLKIGLFAIALCLGATIYPAWKASKLVPKESIRQHE